MRAITASASEYTAPLRCSSPGVKSSMASPSWVWLRLGNLNHIQLGLAAISK